MSTLEPGAAALHGDRAGGHKMRCIRAVQRDERHGSHGGMEAIGWEIPETPRTSRSIIKSMCRSSYKKRDHNLIGHPHLQPHVLLFHGVFLSWLVEKIFFFGKSSEI